MYIKKSVLVIYAVVLVIITSILTAGFLSPFGFSDLKDFLVLSQVSKLINEKYYEDVESDEYVNNAIDGMAKATGDPYTQYLWGEDAQEFMEEIEGNYCGIGVYIENNIEDNTVTVVSAISGTPAEEAGITTGDKILKINGEVFTGEQADEVPNKIKGEEGTTVTITLWRKATGVTEDVELTRREIVVPSVDSEMLSDNIGYINISQFMEDTSEDFEETYRSLETSGMKKLVIDLRNNPGGLLEEAWAIANMFIEDGEIIVYTEDKEGKRTDYVATGDAIEIPMVILTNQGSASASEILTGALKDYGLAYHIGEKTYGKGIVQSVLDIKDYGTLSVTIARYFTPNGVCIHEEGIAPDEEVVMDIEKYINLSKLEPKDDEQLQTAIGYLNK